MKKKRLKKTDANNTMVGNRFHKRVETLFKKLGFAITHSSTTDSGPDIIAFDKDTRTKIIIQCRATRGKRIYPGLENLVSEYSDRRRDHKADLALIALGGYGISRSVRLKDFSKKKVHVITDQFIKEYTSLAGKINKFAKYQVLSDLGISKKLDSSALVTSAFKIRQPGCQFIVASIPPRWLLQTSSVYRRVGPEHHVDGYQRILNKRRVTRDIPDYLKNREWSLPNAIICATQSKEKQVLRVSRTGRIKLQGRTGLFWIIDGQHRLYSFANVDKDIQSTNLLAVIVDSTKLKEDRAKAIQADLFYKLNHHAKRIRGSLVLELVNELIEPETPEQKVAIAIWRSRVFKPIVKSYSSSGGFVDIVTVATASAIKTLCGKDGPILDSDPKYIDGAKVNDRAVDEVSNYITDYLKVIKAVFTTEWANEDYIISDNRGFRALLRLLIYFMRNNNGATKTKVLEEAKRALKKLRAGEDFELKVHEGDWIGEGGATKLAERWIDIFSGIPTSKTIPEEEDENTEFKETYRWDIRQEKINKDLQLVVSKEIAAFMNTRGGTVYLGVADNGTLVGLERDINTLQNKNNFKDVIKRMIVESLNDHLGPDAADAAAIKIDTLDGKQYVTISVRASEDPTYFKDDEFYVRQNARIKELKGRRMFNYTSARFGVD